ncbi:MAG: glycosyltransferase family 39 protein [Phycisphaerae bacterium]|nr:glycosyltransferase family 39 protein [Phycisphaerae bacterium]
MLASPTDPDRRPGGGFYLAIAVFTLLAAVLRLYRLDTTSFWVDELLTVRTCGKLDQMHKSKVFGFVPTALGLMAYGVSPSEIPLDEPERWRAMGISEASSRIGSALVGIVTIPLLGLASCRLLGVRAAGILTLLLAVAPWHIYWSQASRFYSLQFLFYTLALIVYFTATQERSPRRFVMAMVFLILAFLSQPPALVVCAVFAADWLIGLVSRQPVRLGPFGWAAAIASLIVCMAVLGYDVSHAPKDWTQFAGDLRQSPSKMTLGTVYMVGPGVALFAVLTAVQQLSERRRLAIYLALASILPPLVYAVVSTRSYVGLRYAFVCLYGWLALAAIGAERIDHVLRPRLGRALAFSPLGLLLASMLLVDFAYHTGAGGFHTRWRDGFEYVAARKKPGEFVATDREIIGKYYLEDATVGRRPSSAEELRKIEHPLWIVVEAEDAIRGPVHRWLGDVAALKACFNLRVLQPYSSVHVYYYPGRKGATSP